MKLRDCRAGAPTQARSCPVRLAPPPCQILAIPEHESPPPSFRRGSRAHSDASHRDVMACATKLYVDSVREGKRRYLRLDASIKTRRQKSQSLKTLPQPHRQTLTGTGTDTATYDVNLSWDASASSDIAGYNIYRSVYTTSCRSFSKMNSSLNEGTTYTDTVVVDGTAYCYATTSVNTSNQESGYSNIVSNIQIPAP
jgi:hypothetical protein